MANFNKYSQMPFIPYRIMEYLAYNNENIWKLLKYDGYDAIGKPNVEFSEKIKMIWKNEGDQEKYNVFFTHLVENMIPDSTTILKLFKATSIPKSNITGVLAYEFDILYGGKISLVDFDGVPCNRGDVFESEILKTLNGVTVGGVGELQFNTQLTGGSRSSLNLGNSKTFTGTSIVLGVLMNDIGEEGVSCG